MRRSPSGGKGQECVLEAWLDDGEVGDGRVARHELAERGLGARGEQLEPGAVARRSLHAGEGLRLRRGHRGLGSDATAGNQRLDRRRRALGDDAATVEHDDSIGQCIGLFEVVGREDDPGPGGRQLAERRPQASPHLDIEPGRGLVEEEKLGIATDRDREQDSPLLSAGQFAVEPALQPVEAGGGDDGGQRQRIAVVATELIEQLADAERLGHAGGLEHDPHPLSGRDVARIATEEPRCSARRTPQAGEHADRRRLSGAVRTEHGEQLARADG